MVDAAAARNAFLLLGFSSRTLWGSWVQSSPLISVLHAKCINHFKGGAEGRAIPTAAIAIWVCGHVVDIFIA